MLVEELIKELETFDKKLPVFFGIDQVIGVDLDVVMLNNKNRPIVRILVPAGD